MVEIQITAQWPYLRCRRTRITAHAVGWIALSTMVLAGATYNSFAKELLTSINPLSLVFASELLSVGFVLFSFGALPLLHRFSKLSTRTILLLVLVGLLSSVLAPLLWFLGLRSTSAVNASLFSNIDVLFLLVLAVLFLRERWTSVHALAGVIIIAGISLVALRGFQSGVTLQKGDLIIVLAGFTYSLGGLIFRAWLHRIEPQIIIFVRSSIAVIIILTLSLLHPLFTLERISAFPLVLLPVLLGFAFISRFVSIFGFYTALERLPVSTVSFSATFGIVAAPLFARLYFGPSEALLWYHVVGGALILSGTILLELMGIHPSRKHLAQHLEHRAHHRP